MFAFPFHSTLQYLISMLRSSAAGMPLPASQGVETPTLLIKERHRLNRFLLIIAAALFAFAHSMPSQAAQWRIINTTYGSQFYPGWSFEDGQYTANNRNSVFPFNMATSLALPSATSGYITTLRFADWSALYPQMTPPYVDLATSTINLSSLVQEPWRTKYNSGDFSGWYSYEPYDVSYDIGALTPVPFTANGDGTYTATWITPDPLNGYPYGGGMTASITFVLASSVNIEDPGITDSGDVSKTGEDVYIGTNATGTRTVERPGHNFDNIFLGNTPGVDGNLVIRSVPESRTVGELTAAREMVIGNNGTGTVYIQSFGGDKYTPATSARLTGSSIVLGKQAGATGTLTSLYGGSVSTQGTNSIITVGDAGSGTVNITYTGISSKSLVLGNQATGIGQVNAVTSWLSLIGDGANLSVGKEGTGNLSLTPSKNNYVNQFDGSGLTVTDPVNASASIFVGQYPGSQGTLNVCGECTLVADTLRIGLDENDAPGGTGLVNLYAPFVYAPIAFTPKLVKIGPNGVFTQYGTFDPLPSPLPSLNFDLVNQGTFSPVYFGLNGNVTNSGIFEYRTAFWVPVSFTFKKDFTQTASGILKVASLYVDPYFGGVPYKVLGAVNLDGAIEVQGNQIYAPGLYPLIEDLNGIAVGPNFRVLTPNLPIGFSAETVIAPTTISLLITGTIQTDLSLSMTASASSVLQGQTVTYAISVTNNGPSPATSVTVTGTLSSCALGNIASGATATCTRSVTATTAGTLAQTMSVSGSEPDPNTVNNTATVSTTVNPVTDLSLSLSAPVSINQGQSVSYAMSVTNNGPSPATGVTVTGTLPTCTIGNLAAGATANCPASTVTANTVGILTQTMTASGTETDTNLADNSKNVSTTIVQVTADVRVVFLQSLPELVYQGQTVIYNMTVSNNGPSPATGVAATGTLPNCTFGDVAVGAYANCRWTVTATTPGVQIQTMFASGIESDPNTANNTASTSTTVLPAADLGVSLTAPVSVYQGQTVNYSVTVTNYGPSPASGIIVSGLSGCTLGSTTLASGASTGCSASVTATTAGTLTLSVSASGSEMDLNPTNNSASVSTTVNPAIAADLALTMTDSPDPVKKGAKLVYTLTLTNNGPSSATNVSLTDVLPANISFEGIYTSQGKCNGKATITCAIGTLSSGAKATVKITIKPFTVGSISNSASVTSAVGDPNTANNSALVTTQVYR